jgi:DNA-binding IclR family transcriptional regulator
MDVKTAGRTVEIFEAFARTREPMSLSEIGKALDAPMSSSLYLVRALQSRGYLYSVGASRRIYPTRKLLEIGQAISDGESWIDRLEPYLASLRDSTRETIILAKRQRDQVIYLDVHEGPQTIRYNTAVGELKPLHASAMGKALLSALEPRELDKIMKRLRLSAATKNTITSRSALMDDLEQTRERGYAITRGEFVPDVMAIAKPVKLGGDLFGITVAGPMHRMTAEVDNHAAKLIRAVKEIEKNLEEVVS